MDDDVACRLVVTGVDEQGRSCVVKETYLASELTAAEGFRHATLYSTAGPSSEAPRRAGGAELLEGGPPPGQVQWMIVEYEAQQSYPMHHTDTVDLDIVLEGSMELHLDDGIHPLNKGDCAIITGVDHGWRSGPDGCRLSVTFMGVARG
jgi:quercetin dioxygenase-like cupin family protein